MAEKPEGRGGVAACVGGLAAEDAGGDALEQADGGEGEHGAVDE